MLKFPATISKVTTLADGSLRCTVDFQETESMAELFQLRNKLGWFVFAPQEIQITDKDIPDEAIEFKGEKTLDERLNAVMFAYHMQKENNSSTYHQTRRAWYEKHIERFKQLLSELS